MHINHSSNNKYIVYTLYYIIKQTLLATNNETIIKNRVI